MKQSNQIVRALKSVAIALALPVAMFVIMEALAFFTQGEHIIKSSLDIKNLIRSSGISAAIAFAWSMNLTSGRMDLSLGAQRVAATICGGFAATALGLGGIWILVFAILFGVLFGGLVGTVFVTLRIPPMVLGIGMACILECVGFALAGGAGFKMGTAAGSAALSDVNFTIAVVAVMLVAMLLLMTYTTFGSRFRAVRGSQFIAATAGGNVFSNMSLD